MKPKYHGFSCFFHSTLSLNPGVAFKVAFKPLLFHLVRGQHMMPNVIRGWCVWCHLSSDVFNARRSCRTVAESQRSPMEVVELTVFANVVTLVMQVSAPVE
jgi:hypothetical protein